MFKILPEPPPPPLRLPSASFAIASPVTRGKFVMFLFVLVPRKHQDGGQGESGLVLAPFQFDKPKQPWGPSSLFSN